MQLNEIVSKLHRYYELREIHKAAEAETKRYHAEVLMPLAVSLGMDQQDAVSGGAKFFLDGYLVSYGRIPKDRCIDIDTGTDADQSLGEMKS